MRRGIILFCSVFLFMNASYALVVNNHSASSAVAQIQAEYDNVNMSKDEIIATLRADIAEIDNQLAQCKKQKKGWTAATVIGSVGVVGTGVGALVQNKQIKEKKADLENVQKELRSIQ